MPFETISRVLVWRQIVDQVGSAIVDGSLKPGEVLPTERELCERFGVSRASTREALRVLEAQGLIVNHETQGRTVAPDGASSALHQALKQLTDLHAVGIDDLVDFRCLIETHAARAAAKKPVEGSLAKAREVFEESVELSEERHSAGNFADFEAADIRFHVALVAAAGNDAETITMQALRPIVTRRLDEGLDSISDAEESMGQFTEEHGKILKAIEAGQGDKAADLIESHVREAYTRFAAARSKAAGHD